MKTAQNCHKRLSPDLCILCDQLLGERIQQIPDEDRTVLTQDGSLKPSQSQLGWRAKLRSFSVIRVSDILPVEALRIVPLPHHIQACDTA
jgi:hypothetical protein